MAGIAPAPAASVVRIAAPVGVTSSRRMPVSNVGKPLSSSAVAGPGTGMRPCGPSTKPPPDRQGSEVDGVDAEQMEADARAGHVHDGVHRAHVVEVHALRASCRAPALRPRPAVGRSGRPCPAPRAASRLRSRMSRISPSPRCRPARGGARPGLPRGPCSRDHGRSRPSARRSWWRGSPPSSPRGAPGGSPRRRDPRARARGSRTAPPRPPARPGSCRPRRRSGSRSRRGACRVSGAWRRAC